MRLPIAWAHRLIVASVASCLLGSGSMALGLLLLAASFDIGPPPFLGYLIVSSALVVGGVVGLLLAFVLE
jgi:hypothetical protein